MAHVTLDGITIPISGIDTSLVETGKRQRAFNGTYLINRQSTKREWSLDTPWMLPTEAEMVRGIVQGDGQNWSLEQGTLHTTKGTPPSAGTGYVLPGAYAADGDSVLDGYGDLPTQYGGYALGHYYPSRGNQLVTGTATAEATTGSYTSEGGTGVSMAIDTTHYWQGAKSLEITFPGDASWASARSLAGDSSSTGIQQGSVYLKGAAGGEQVRVYLDNADPGAPVTGTKTDVTLSATIWKQVFCELDVSAGAPDTRLVVSIDSGAGEVVYADGWQIIRSQLPVPWIDGTATALSLWYDWSVMPRRYDNTMCAWVHMPDQSKVSTRRIIVCAYDNYVGTQHLFYLERRADLNVGLRWTTGSEGGSTHDLDYGTDAIWATGWHHIAAVASHNPDTGRYNKELYFDGAPVGDVNTALIPDFKPGTDEVFNILSGDKGGTYPMFGRLDQLRILPYALTATAVAAIYGASIGVGETPEINLDGDGIAPSSATVIGRVNSVNQRIAGSGYLKSVSFDLKEI
jgi:hypothetical protein